MKRIRVAFKAFTCYITISRGTFRRVWRFWRNAAKNFSLKTKSKCFCSNWCINMPKRPFFFRQNVVFTDETRVRISSDGIGRVFQRSVKRFLEFGQTVTFQKNNPPVHKSKIIGIFFKKTSWRYLNNQHTDNIWILLKNFWSILEQRLRKHSFLWENLDEKVY